ncbi:hypothetical protein CDD83_1591 [Cordyceps sp. RAO-2017]|nr:hypothetical protein CDD83_1591 [Cordyceps sp. RAO-2017]
MSALRRSIHHNPGARTWAAAASASTEEADAVRRFHGHFPGAGGCGSTRLVSLDDVASHLGVRHVLVKDESCRFGLPSFKILGASWATFRALARRLSLPLDEADLSTLSRALAARPVTLYAASEGNHGRAVARTAKLLDLPAEIHVPADMQPSTIDSLQTEGARVVVAASYDDALHAARRAADLSQHGLLIQDFAFDGYQDVPQWVVDGYGTMLREIDSQLDGEPPSLIVTPVGVGSLAQAVVSHAKRARRVAGAGGTAVMTVEPDTAACLYQSLRREERVQVRTHGSIMAGLDCGTVSPTAWPTLQAGVDASLTVSDHEAHRAARYLQSRGVSAGVCGAAPLAAIRRLSASDKARLGLDSSSVVVLLCTEGHKDYAEPADVSMDDATGLAQALVRIDSANPSLGLPAGPGESAIARYVAAWLEHRDIETHWLEPAEGRPSVVAVVRGSGGGKSLMLNGHLDTVTTAGYGKNPLSGHVEDGRLYGRGAGDMKGGVAACLVALAGAKAQGLRGDVIFTGVSDEEATSIGTEAVLQAGWTADGAIVAEPTAEDLVSGHKGFVWFQVDVHGVAAHGSLPGAGVDAITRAGHFLVALDKYSGRLAREAPSPAAAPSVHASTIQGGEEASSYPALCRLVLERRTMPGETVGSVRREIQGLLDDLSRTVPDFRSDLKVTFSRPAFAADPDHPFVLLVSDTVNGALGRPPSLTRAAFWTDAALLAANGIPAVVWGPRAGGIHGKEEWADVASIERVASILGCFASRFCD